MENVISGIYNSIGPKEQGSDEHLLVSDEKIYTLTVRRFSEGDQIGPNTVPLNVKVGEDVVKVLVDKAELVKKLGLATNVRIPDANREAFIQEKMLWRLKEKAFNSSELGVFKGVQAHWQGQPLKFDKKQIKEIFTFFRLEPTEKAIEGYEQTVARFQEKLFRRHPELKKPKYLTGVRVAAFLLAHKTLEDRPFDNPSIAKRLRLSKKEIDELEELFLKGIDWDLNLSDVKKERSIRGLPEEIDAEVKGKAVISLNDYDTLRRFKRSNPNVTNANELINKSSGNNIEIAKRIVNTADKICETLTKKYIIFKINDFRPALKIASLYMACKSEGKVALKDWDYVEGLGVYPEDFRELEKILKKGLES